MSITMNLRYTGKDGAALKFAKEMQTSGIVASIRSEPGNERYEYFVSCEDPETVLLIDAWKDQEALDVHHSSPMMQSVLDLREKYRLSVTAERYRSDNESIPESDRAFASPAS